MTIWISSDLHLGHENIIQYGQRPFKDVVEMGEKLREYHNSLVKPSDHWYNLGDVTMKRGGRVQQEWFINEMKKWNGHKRLIMGNHDHLTLKTYAVVFEKILGTGRWMDNMWLSHFPIHPTAMGNADACIHGHIHQNRSPEPVIQIDKTQRIRYKPYINVSVEAIGYKPVSLEEVKDMVKRARGEYEGVQS
jgi:calcineurin-like phosphoesterase family protein